MLDASRAVGVAGSLLSDDLRDEFVRQVRGRSTQAMRERARRPRQRRASGSPIAEARANRLRDRLAGVTAAQADASSASGRWSDYPLAELVDRIDWTPFFQTWELAGHYPAILDDPAVGQTARSLFDDARALLDRIVREDLLEARAVVGFWPADSVGDDIELYTDDGRRRAARGDPHAAAADARSSRAGPTSRWPTSSPRARAASRTTSARSR